MLISAVTGPKLVFCDPTCVHTDTKYRNPAVFAQLSRVTGKQRNALRYRIIGLIHSMRPITRVL